MVKETFNRISQDSVGLVQLIESLLQAATPKGTNKIRHSHILADIGHLAPRLFVRRIVGALGNRCWYNTWSGRWVFKRNKAAGLR
jgi:hypothetical protein